MGTVGREGQRACQVRRQLIKHNVFDLQVTSLFRVALRHSPETYIFGILPEKLQPCRFPFCSVLGFDLSFSRKSRRDFTFICSKIT